ncbi:MAG: ABC transporter permease [Spirochaetales bacterium]|nr:ABC transporter permease [Spirochaetales bacterium]
MGKYILRRILIAIPMLLLVTIIVFILASLMPGDAAMAMFGSGDGSMTAEMIEQQRENMGLTGSVLARYFRWLGKLLKGDMGVSMVSFEPVWQMIKLRIGPTLLLMGTSLILSIIIGVILGCFSAVKQYSAADYILTVISFIGRSVPIFFLGLFLVYIFALKLSLFPTSGMHTMGYSDFGDLMKHLFLPCLSLSILRIAEFLRYSRASMLEVLHSDFIWTARSKGIKEFRVLRMHALRNALIPIITLIGINIPVLFSGAIMIEQVFQWPGLGMLFNTAVNQRDQSLLMGLCLFSSVIVLLSNLLTDIAYAAVDPRIRYE